jgi:hypothetical protein
MLLVIAGNLRASLRTASGPHEKEDPMLILLVVLIVLLLAAAPTWPYSRSWGYYPSGSAGTILLILVLLLLLGYVHL